MVYVQTTWLHESARLPVEIFSEVGDDGYEIRRVQQYRDGNLEWADEDHETNTAGLSETPIRLDNNPDLPELDTRLIDVRLFEQMWAHARGVGRAASDDPQSLKPRFHW